MAAQALSVDPFGAAASLAMAAHLCGPFRAGALSSIIPIADDGTIRVTGVTRDPILLIAPAAPLRDRRLTITAVLDPEGAATPLASGVVFAPYSEAGSFLPLHVPAVDVTLRTAAAFSIRIAVALTDRDNNALPPPPEPIGTLLTATLSEGTLGKLIYILGSEKVRIRRQACELAAMRALGDARWDALDRFGADVGVPRFGDRLAYDAAKREIFTQVPLQNGEPVPESDAAYRRRLRPYFEWLTPNRRRVLDLLNGPGAPGSPNEGTLAAMGFQNRFAVEERTNEFAVAVHIVGQTPAALQRFHDYVRAQRLVWPATFANNDPHDGRFLNTTQRASLQQLRARLRAQYTFETTDGLAPSLAAALDRAGRLMAALGAPAPVAVARTFDPAAGSRYELGLGADLTALAAADLDAMHAALTDPDPPVSPDPETQALLMLVRTSSRSAADDPHGRWLWEAAGMRTIHLLGNGEIYLSPLPTFGLVVTESAQQPADGGVALVAHYHGSGDPGANAVLEAALTAGAAEWTSQGREAFTRLDDVVLRARWNANVAQPAAVRNVFTAAGLPAVDALPSIATALNNVPPELIEGIELDAALSLRIFANDPSAVDDLAALADLFGRHHLSAILPFVSAPNQITVLLGAIGLPQAGVNLSDRIASGFRWYAAALDGPAGAIKPTGVRSIYRPAPASTLTAIVVLGYARRGLADPYEFRLELPPDALLTLEQYEFVMNVLERVCPIGVQANTFSIRQSHVDLDGDGSAEALPPSLFRTYRRYHRRHMRGEITPGPAGA